MVDVVRPLDKAVIEGFENDARSVGALHGSARGQRNITGRIDAMARLAPLEGTRLLDIGCGSGEYTSVMSHNFEAVDAIDIEPERLELFEQQRPHNATVAAMSANELNFDDDTFDVVTLIEVLEHLVDPVVALIEIRRVLKPGGRLLLTTPNRFWPIEQHGVLVGEKRYPGPYAPGLVWVKPLHRRFSDANAFTKKDLSTLARQAGMRLVDVTYMMPPLDSLGTGSKVHDALDKLETSPLSPLGQTIVGHLEL